MAPATAQQPRASSTFKLRSTPGPQGSACTRAGLLILHCHACDCMCVRNCMGACVRQACRLFVCSACALHVCMHEI